MDPRLLSIALQELPAAIVALKAAFSWQHPDAPDPTDAEVIAAYQSALVSSLAKDAAWLDAHPHS